MNAFIFIVLCIAAVISANAQQEKIGPNELRHFETTENTFSIILPREDEGYAYIIMQPCFGRDLILCKFH